jgi:hypothetical protein
MPRGEAALKLGRVRAGLTPVVPPSLLFVLVGDLMRFRYCCCLV